MLEAMLLTGTMLALILLAGWVFILLEQRNSYTLDDGTVVAGYSVLEQLVKHDNPAVGIRYGFFLLAFVVAFWNTVHPSGVSLGEDLNLLAKYGLLVLGLLLVSQQVNDKCILRMFDNDKEVVADKNVEVATVEGSTLLATALILSGALAELQTGHVWSALLWCGLGQGFLVLLFQLYAFFNPAISQALDDHKMAPALSLSGFLFAGGMMLGHGLLDPTPDFWADFRATLGYAGVWIVVMGVTRWVMDFALIPGAKIKAELYHDDNVGIGVLDGLSFVAVTLFYTLVW